jgi:1-acyl-sn-glycerol-3-phosphate acyltransferase
MRKKTKTPNAVLYFLVYIIIYPVLKTVFRLKVDRSDYKPPKGAFIVVSNHISFMDFLLVMLSVYSGKFIRLNALTAQKFFFYSPLHKFLPMMGCIPKNLFDPDIRAIIALKSVLKRGGKILIFPEGRCSVHGSYMGMHKTTGSLIKNLGVPVVSCHIAGAYLCMPFWRKSGTRAGKTQVTLANLFTPEDLKSMSVDEINAAIDQSLSGANVPEPKKPFKIFRAKRLVEGLENMIYYCPKCSREFTLETKNNKICCAACGNSAEMDVYGKLTPSPGSMIPESVSAWYRAQAAYEKKALESFELLEIPATVRMQAKQPGKGLDPAGEGILHLDPGGWHYKGRLHGENADIFFPIDSVPAMPFDPNDNFQIYSDGKFYAFCPKDNARACAKYATVGECAYWKFASSVQMTNNDFI